MESLPFATALALCSALRACDVEFVIVGGFAVSLVGRPRYTADVDAVLWEVDSRLSEILTCLTAKGFRPRSENSMEIARRSRVLLLEDDNAVGVDLSMGMLPFERWMIDSARDIQADSVHLPIATAEALIVMKSIAWRPKDLDDIRELVASNPELDRGLVMTYAEPFLELLEVPERIDALRNMIA